MDEGRATLTDLIRKDRAPQAIPALLCLTMDDTGCLSFLLIGLLIVLLLAAVL